MLRGAAACARWMSQHVDVRAFQEHAVPARSSRSGPETAPSAPRRSRCRAVRGSRRPDPWCVGADVALDAASSVMPSIRRRWRGPARACASARRRRGRWPSRAPGCGRDREIRKPASRAAAPWPGWSSLPSVAVVCNADRREVVALDEGGHAPSLAASISPAAHAVPARSMRGRELRRCPASVVGDATSSSTRNRPYSFSLSPRDRAIAKPMLWALRR